MKNYIGLYHFLAGAATAVTSEDNC